MIFDMQSAPAYGSGNRVRAVLAISVSVAWLTAVPLVLAETFRKGPYLLPAASNSAMRVVWQAKESSSAVLVWGPTPACVAGSMVVDGITEPHMPAKHLLTDLKPSTRYHYRVTSQSVTSEGSFMTPPAVNAARATFYGLGDTRSNPSALNAVVSRLMLDVAGAPDTRQSLTVVTGDMVQRGEQEASWENEFFAGAYSGIHQWLSAMPVAVCRGNHEGAAELLRGYFPYQGLDKSFSYAFDYGPVRFIVLDQYAPLEAGSPQYIWLERELQTHRGRWLVPVFHEPAFSAGGSHQPNETAVQVLEPLFQRYGVVLTMAGHNHYYAHVLHAGIHHLTLGGGGAPQSTPQTNLSGVVKAEAALHFARFEVDGQSMAVTVIRADGSVLERFTITREPPQLAPDDFTLAVLPDTQYYTGTKKGGTPAHFLAQTDWIVSNRLSRRIAYVAHVGDVVETRDANGGNVVEWSHATNALYRLENPVATGLPDGIPYGVAFGNHDGLAVGGPLLGPAHFTNHSYYGGQAGGSCNRFDLFRAGGVDFMALYLDFDGATNVAAVALVRDILRAQSNRRVIVITHSLINTGQSATFTPEGKAWVEALKDATNIVLWLCGHRPGEGRRNGNSLEVGPLAPMLLSDYQKRPSGGEGWLRLLQFSPSTNRIYVRTYSPVLDRWETDGDSQFEVPCLLRVP